MKMVLQPSLRQETRELYLFEHHVENMDKERSVQTYREFNLLTTHHIVPLCFVEVRF